MPVRAGGCVRKGSDSDLAPAITSEFEALHATRLTEKAEEHTTTASKTKIWFIILIRKQDRLNGAR